MSQPTAAREHRIARRPELDPAPSMRRLHERHGVKFVPRATVARFEETPAGVTVHLKDGGSVEADVARDADLAAMHELLRMADPRLPERRRPTAAQLRAGGYSPVRERAEEDRASAARARAMAHETRKIIGDLRARDDAHRAATRSKMRPMG